MDVLIALTLLAAVSGEPALAGGPEAAEVRVEQRSEYSRGYRAEYRSTVSRHGEAQGAAASDRRPAGRQADRAAVRAGDPVRLGPDFFAAPMAGGVERPVRVQVYGRHGVIVIGPHAPGPVSAGQAAAARGLPRG